MKNLIFFLLCCFAIKSYSQDEKSFLVIKVKGTCYYNRDKFKIPLKIGTYLSINDEVTIGKSSSASLVCNNNKLFTINNALQTISPKISLKKYQDSCVTLKQSVSADFIKYVLKNIPHEHTVNIDDEHLKNLKEMGAVVRGCGEKAFEKIRDTIYLYQKTCSIKYQKNDANEKLEFALYNEEDAMIPVYKTAVAKNKIMLNSEVLKLLQPNQNYYWTILRNGTTVCDKKVIVKLGDEAYKNLLTTIKQADFTSLSKQNQNSVLAFMLAKNNLIAEAYSNIKTTSDILMQQLKQDLEEGYVF